MERTDDPGLLRIGELSRRSGVSDHLLRAWESRYGLLRPVRSAGGFRLYSTADVDRVRRMRASLDSGLSAAQAAAAALTQEVVVQQERIQLPADTDSTVVAGSGDADDRLAALRDKLRGGFDGFDEAAAQAALDRLLAVFSLSTVLREVVIPYLNQLGDRWQYGTASIAQEHFASNIIHGRLAGLARGWGAGSGRVVLLACPPDEHHDLALMAFGVVLFRSGWSVRFLGASTPISELVRAVTVIAPDLTVLAASTAERFDAVAAELTALAAETSLAIAGAGAQPALADRIGAQLLDDDPVTAAERIGRRP